MQSRVFLCDAGGLQGLGWRGVLSRRQLRGLIASAKPDSIVEQDSNPVRRRGHSLLLADA